MLDGDKSMKNNFINFDNTYISISREAGSEIQNIMNREIKFEDLRKFMIPAIKEGGVVPDTMNYHFLWFISIGKTNRYVKPTPMVLFCSLSAGAPAPETAYTMTVYNAVTPRDASDFIKSKKSFFLFAKREFEENDKLFGIERVKSKNYVKNDCVVFLDGVEYKKNDMSVAEKKDLYNKVTSEIAALKVKQAQLATTYAESKQSKDYFFELSATRKILSEIHQQSQKWLSDGKTMNFSEILIGVMSEFLKADDLSAILNEAERRKGQAVT